MRLYHQRRARFESKRRKRQKSTRHTVIANRRKQGRHRIPAPVALDLYRGKNYNSTTKFLKDLRDSASEENILICFRDTKTISAAAGLLFIAEVDRIVKQFGKDRINCTLPPTQTRVKGSRDNTVDAVLSQIGFYKLIGKRRNVTSTAAHVVCWQYESGAATRGESAGAILEKVSHLHPSIPSQKLYRGCIEAMANCVEHAYIAPRADDLGIDDRRWWLFAGVIDSTLTMLICDLGVGIPNTIQVSQDKSILDKIFSLFNFKAETDSGWIKTATLVKETRTLSVHRGKGGGDIRSLVSKTPSSSLTIFSNKGKYIFRNTSEGTYQPEILRDHHSSILGTIVEWTVPIKSKA